MKVSAVFAVLAVVFLVLSIFTAVPLWVSLACLCVAVFVMAIGY